MYTVIGNTALENLATKNHKTYVPFTCSTSDETNYNSCEFETITVCETPDSYTVSGVGTYQSYVVCDSDNCEKVFPNQIPTACSTITLAVGPACQVTNSSCLGTDVEQEQYLWEPSDLSSLSALGTCSGMDCVNAYKHVTTCTVENKTINASYYDNSVSDTAYCVDGGDESIWLETPDGAKIYCGDIPDEPIQDFGDYWCPEEYDFGLDNIAHCVLDEFVCDAGLNGQLENGCDYAGFIAGTDDPLFRHYNSACVDRSDINLEAYDVACCLSATFNNFAIYETNDEGQNPNHVRVY